MEGRRREEKEKKEKEKRIEETKREDNRKEVEVRDEDASSDLRPSLMVRIVNNKIYYDSVLD